MAASFGEEQLHTFGERERELLLSYYGQSLNRGCASKAKLFLQAKALAPYFHMKPAVSSAHTGAMTIKVEAALDSLHLHVESRAYAC